MSVDLFNFFEFVAPMFVTTAVDEAGVVTRVDRVVNEVDVVGGLEEFLLVNVVVATDFG